MTTPIPTLRATSRDGNGGRIVEATLPGSESWTVGTVRWSTPLRSYRLHTADGADLIPPGHRPPTIGAALALAREAVAVPQAARPAPKVPRLRGVRRVEHKVTMYEQEWADVDRLAEQECGGNRSEAVRQLIADGRRWRNLPVQRHDTA